MMTIASIDVTSPIASATTIGMSSVDSSPVGEDVRPAMSLQTSDGQPLAFNEQPLASTLFPQPTPPFGELCELVSDNAVLGKALQSLVDNIDVEFSGGTAIPPVAVDVAPDVVEGTPENISGRGDAIVVDCGRQVSSDPAINVTPVASNDKPVNVATPVAADIEPFVAEAESTVPDGREESSIAAAVVEKKPDVAIPITTQQDDSLVVDYGLQGPVDATINVTPVASNDKSVNVTTPVASNGKSVNVTTPVASNDKPVNVTTPVASNGKPVNVTTPVASNDKLVNVTTPVAADIEPFVAEAESTVPDGRAASPIAAADAEKKPDVAIPITTQRDDSLVVDYGRQRAADAAINADNATVISASDKPRVEAVDRLTSADGVVDESDEVVLQAAPVVEAPVANSTTAPVSGASLDSVAAVSQVAPVDAPAMFVAVAQEIAAAVTVSPALMRGDAGEIRVQLRPDVLEGSEVIVAVDGKKMDVTFVPTVTRVADVVVSNQSLVQQQLASKISGFEISVSVAQTVATNVATAVGSAHAANVAVNRIRRTNGRA